MQSFNAPQIRTTQNNSSQNLLIQDDSIIKLVDRILFDALLQNASDVHFEPYADVFRVRFRVDGILYETAKLDISIVQRLNARLKVMAKLDVAEKRLPQDGRFALEIKGQMRGSGERLPESRDCRVSTCPTIHGEKIAVRILHSADNALDADHLGFSLAQKQLFLAHTKAAQGMILATGPTGSGKTATLYTAINLLNDVARNISTIEDPVEITLHGINQVEVNLKTDLTFARVLRTFLRQDPDVIMVGEIRDLETAQIAIHAAQTGHLVLSTLHTNSAAESITRLLNMGISHFNLATSVNFIIAQRLIRKLCPHCKQAQSLPQKIILEEGMGVGAALQACALDITLGTECVVYKALGCAQCKDGYKGRSGIFELLPISARISEMILQQANILEIEREARRAGMKTLRESALQKVILGETSLEEMNRVLG